MEEDDEEEEEEEKEEEVEADDEEEEEEEEEKGEEKVEEEEEIEAESVVRGTSLIIAKQVGGTDNLQFFRTEINKKPVPLREYIRVNYKDKSDEVV